MSKGVFGDRWLHVTAYKAATRFDHATEKRPPVLDAVLGVHR